MQTNIHLSPGKSRTLGSSEEASLTTNQVRNFGLKAVATKPRITKIAKKLANFVAKIVLLAMATKTVPAWSADLTEVS